MAASAGAANWSGSVPVDLLRLIVEKMDSFGDFLAFAVTCRSWYSVAADYRISDSAPWLMLAEKKEEDSPMQRGFYSFSSGELFEIELPEIRGSRCWGSPFGWLVTYHITDFDVNLFNPLSRASIPLPNLKSLVTSIHRPGYGWIPDLLGKAVLTASPESPNCSVFLIISPETLEIAFAKPGDTAWSPLDGEVAGFCDITYFQAKLYGCQWDTEIIVTLDVTKSSESGVGVEEFAAPPPELRHRAFEIGSGFYRRKYLVDLGGELCLVLHYLNPALYTFPSVDTYSLTNEFEIYKVDLCSKEWKQLHF